MGVVGKASDLFLQSVLMVEDGKETNVIFYVDRFGYPYALTQTGMDQAAVTARARSASFSEIADWMTIGDFAALDAYLLTVRGMILAQLGPILPFLEA